MSLSDWLSIIAIVMGIFGSLVGGIFSYYFIKWWETDPARLKKWPPWRMRLLTRTIFVLSLIAIVGGAGWWFLHRGQAQCHELSDEALCVAWSPDGLMFAAGGKESYVRVWDAKTGRELGRLRGKTRAFTAPVRYLAFSPDSKRLAAGGNEYFWIWEIANGDELWTFSSFQTVSPKVPRRSPESVGAEPGIDGGDRAGLDVIEGLAFLSNPQRPQQLLVAWYGAGLTLYDVDARRQIDVFEWTDRFKEGLALSHDGRYAVTSGSIYDEFELWDIATKKSVGRSGSTENNLTNGVLDPQKDMWASIRNSLSEHVTSFALSRNPRYLLSASHFNVGKPDPALQINDILVWDVGTWRVVRRFHGHQQKISALAVAENDRLVSGSKDGMVAVWDFDSAALLQRYFGHLDYFGFRSSAVTAVAISPDGNAAVSAGGDRTVRVWSVLH